MKDQTRMHVGYTVSNIEKTIEFYNKFFETEPVKIKEGYAKYLLDSPSLNISFNLGSRPEPQHIHFGIEVQDPEILKKKLGNALSQNLPVDEQNEVKCCYAKQDKFWVTDPDGYKWEVFKFLEDVEENDKEYASEGACCS